MRWNNHQGTQSRWHYIQIYCFFYTDQRCCVDILRYFKPYVSTTSSVFDNLVRKEHRKHRVVAFEVSKIHSVNMECTHDSTMNTMTLKIKVHDIFYFVQYLENTLTTYTNTCIFLDMIALRSKVVPSST